MHETDACKLHKFHLHHCCDANPARVKLFAGHHKSAYAQVMQSKLEILSYKHGTPDMSTPMYFYLIMDLVTTGTQQLLCDLPGDSLQIAYTTAMTVHAAMTTPVVEAAT